MKTVFRCAPSCAVSLEEDYTGNRRDLTCLIRAIINRVACGDKDASLSGFRGDMSGLARFNSDLLTHIQHGTGRTARALSRANVFAKGDK